MNLEEASPIYNLLIGWLADYPLLNAIITALVLFLQAAMINRLVIKHRLSKTISLIPGLVYIVLMNALPEHRGMSPIILGNLFALLFLLNTFPILRLYQTEKYIFNMGFWSAVAGVVFPNYFVLILLAVVSLLILRSFSKRELGQVAVGFLCALVIIGTLFYLMNDLGGFWASFGTFQPRNLLFFFDFTSWSSSMILIVTYLLILIVLRNYYKVLAKQSIKEQKKLNLVYWLVALAFLGMIGNPNFNPSDLLSIAIPLSIILGIVTAKWKLKFAAEFLHLLVVMGILYLHF
jgi:hypothetical protein